MLLPTKKVSSTITSIQVRTKECRTCRKSYYFLNEDEIEAETTGIILSSDDNKLEKIVKERLIKNLKKSLNEKNTDNFCPHCLRQPSEHSLERQFQLIIAALIFGVLLGGGLAAFIVPFSGLDVSNIIYYMIYSALTVTFLVYILGNLNTKPDFYDGPSSRTLKESMKPEEFTKWIENSEHPVREWYADINKEEPPESEQEEIEEELIIDLGIDTSDTIGNKIPSTEILLKQIDEDGIQSLLFNKSYFGF